MSEMCYHCMQPAMRHGRCSACGHAPISYSAADTQTILPPGTRLDNGSIIIGEAMGHGGFGNTYIARDSQYGLIALKEFFPRQFAYRNGTCLMPHPQHERDFQLYLQDFRREIKHLLNLSGHPNIIRVLFDLEENNTFYYGMDLLKGETLKEYVQRQPMLSPQKAFSILSPIISALSYAHGRKTLHRDIAPDNIFLRANPLHPEHPSPCLIDFGAAYSARPEFTQRVPSVRKAGYSPYEQLGGLNQQGPFTDVYAITATLYYMLTKTTPVSSDQRVKHFVPLQPASQYNPEVSPMLNHVIETGMALDHTKRYPTMDHLQSALINAIPRSLPGQKKASLVCQRGLLDGQTFALSSDYIIGREGTLRIPPEDRLTSRRHCRVFSQNGTWYLADLQSHNGTSVNGSKLMPGAAVVLHPGDRIQVGAEEFFFQISQ